MEHVRLHGGAGAGCVAGHKGVDNSAVFTDIQLTQPMGHSYSLPDVIFGEELVHLFDHPLEVLIPGSSMNGAMKLVIRLVQLAAERRFLLPVHAPALELAHGLIQDGLTGT